MRGMKARLDVFLIALFLIYAFIRVVPNLPALSRPRELTDTKAYVVIALRPLLDVEFWGSGKPFVFPLLLKITGLDFPAAAAMQLGLSILTWGLLALSVSASLRTLWLKPFAFALILAVSLVRHLAGWDFVMMSESLSVSFFVLFLAVGIWLLRGWRADKVIAFILTGFLLIFTRDTNAYVLLVLAGLLLLAVILRWTQPRTLIVVVSFLILFILNGVNADMGSRWTFPLTNVIGKRVLPYSQAVASFEGCGMPVTPELLSLAGEFANGNDRAFYNDPALESFREWFAAHSRSCYMRWLISNPVHSIGESLSEFGNLVAFNDVDFFFSRRYEPFLPWRMERILYPTHFTVLLWLILTLAALIAARKKAWQVNTLWAAFILLCLPILPHLFITWHGDAMAPARHALSVALQLVLSLWLLIFLLADQLLFRYIPNRPKDEQNAEIA